MKKFEKKTLIIYGVIILYILVCNILHHQNDSNLLNFIINPIFFLTFFLLCIWTNQNAKQRVKFQTAKLQTIFITIAIYLIIYFLLGLFLGYSKSIYNHSILGIIKNIWIYIVPIFIIEYLRKTLVVQNHSLISDTITTILFTTISINLYSIFHITNYSILFKNVFSMIIPTLASNILLIYLSRSSGYYGALFYQVPQTLVMILLPILPSLNWYYTSVLGILLPLLVFIFVKNVDYKLISRQPRRIIKKQSSLKLLSIFFPLLLLILFATGILKYKPISILSNSMHPEFDRGDIVIVQKLSKEELRNIKKYDIIEYILESDIITHRVIHIEKHDNGKNLYTTKGDNNNAPDIRKVKEEQIQGKIIFRIPKLGYPTVWLSEFFHKNRNVAVEVGK